MGLNLVHKLIRSSYLRIQLAVVFLVSQVAPPFMGSNRLQAGESSTAEVAIEGHLPTSEPAITFPFNSAGERQAEIQTVFIPNLLAVDDFAKRLADRVLQLQTQGGMERVQLQIYHFGNARSAPPELLWLAAHGAALRERGVQLDIVIRFVDVDGESADAAAEGIRNLFRTHENEAAQLGGATRQKLEKLLDLLGDLQSVVTLSDAEQEAMDSRLSMTDVSRWVGKLKGTLPKMQQILDDVLKHLTQEHSKGSDFADQSQWFRAARDGLEKILSEYESMTSKEIIAGLDESVQPHAQRTKKLLASVVDLLGDVSQQYQELAGFYKLNYGDAKSSLSGEDLRSDNSRELSVWRHLGKVMGLSVRRFWSLPRGITFAMYTEIFRPSTHSSALAEAARAIRHMVNEFGIPSGRELIESYKGMSSDTRKMLELYGQGAFRALLGFGISWGTMSYAASQNPEMVTHVFAGSLATLAWMFFTGVIGVANLDFFKSAKSYDPYRGYVTNKAFFYVTTFIHSFLISLNTQQFFYGRFNLGVDMVIHTFKNSLLSTFAKLAPTLFIAENRDDGTGNHEKTSQRHTVHKTIFMNFLLDTFYQSIKSLNLYDQANKPFAWILRVMAGGGAAAMVIQHFKIRREVRSARAQESVIPRERQTTWIRLSVGAPTCAGVFR